MSRQGGVICGVVLDRAGCIVLHVSFFFYPTQKQFVMDLNKQKQGPTELKASIVQI